MSRRALRNALAALSLAALSLAPVAARAQSDNAPSDDAGAALGPSANAASETSETSDAESRSDNASDPDTTEEAAPGNPFTAAAPAEIENSLSRALSDSKVSFCKAQELPVLSDISLCSLAHLRARQRCPALARACAAKEKTRDSDSASWSWLGDLAFWLVVVALVVVLALAFRSVIGAQRVAGREVPARPDLPADPANAPRLAGETDVARLWARAEQAASRAHYDDAVAAVQGALIHALRISGKLHVSPAQTNGDYLRALRPEPALHGTARAVFRAAEGVQFGGAAASAQLYGELFERVRPIILHALAAAVLLVLAVGQSGCAKSFGLDPDGDAHGLGVLTQVLTDQHTTVRRRVRALNVIEPEVTAIFVTSEQPDEAWSKLLGWARAGGTLIIAQGSSPLAADAATHFTSRGYGGPLDLAPGFEPTRLELSVVAKHTLDLPPEKTPFDRTFANAEGRPYVAARNHGAGRLIFFADPEFLENASLSVGDNALFAVSLLRRPGQVLELVGPWTGGGADSTLGAFRSAGLGILLVQLCVLGLLFAWHGGAAFGTRHDATTERRRAFRDHVLALGANYRRARATRFALATYGAWLIERLRDRLSPQQPIGLIDLAGRIAARIPEPEAELVSLLVEARQAQEDSEAARPSPADLDALYRLETLAMRVGGSK
jgi:hypothetical protein